MFFVKIAAMIRNMFTPTTRTDELEKYLASKHPQTAEDVEYYIRQFDREMGGRAVWWN